MKTPNEINRNLICLRPMEWEEVVACAAVGIPVWEEVRGIHGHVQPEDAARQLEYHDAQTHYGEQWRDWRVKPSAAEMDAAEWRE